jgi:DNA gyrase subunit A
VNLNEGDELIGVDLTSGSDEVMLFSAAGKVVRFKENAVRAMGRTATGVRGIKLAGEDSVVSLIIPRGEGAILTVTQNGYGKRTAGIPDQVSRHAGRYLYQSDRAQRFRCGRGAGR